MMDNQSNIIKRNIFPHTSQPGQSILRCDGARLRSSLVDCLTNDHIIPQFYCES